MPLLDHTIENMYGDFKIGMRILTMNEFFDLWPECSEDQLKQMNEMLDKEENARERIGGIKNG